MIVTRSPLRLSIGGGGTDLPFYSSKFGGSLVTAAIDKYNYIILEKREFYNDFLVRYSKTERVKSIDEIEHKSIKAALQYLDVKDPIEITALADVPAGTGLGNSSAFLVALLKSLHTYKRESVSAKRLAEEAADIEMNVLGEPIGKQDHYASSFGGLIGMEIDKKGNVAISPLNISYSALEDLENNTLLFSTGFTRSSSEIISDQKKQAEADEEKIKHMHLVRDIGWEIKKSLEQGDVSKFGKWLNVHWEAKRKLSDKMSSEKIDGYYESALKNGAIGGKLVGAGGGGFLLFYCDGNKLRLREAMQKQGLKELPFKFDTDGCKIIHNGR